MTAGGPVMATGEPNPTGLGRYCLPPPGTCYCRGCPHYEPLNADEYARLVKKARRELAESNDRKRGRR